MIRRAGLLLVTGLLILLSVAKLAGVVYLLWQGSEMPDHFVFKQAVYSIVLIAAGAGMLIATRRSGA
jgi:hypothetical protein